MRKGTLMRARMRAGLRGARTRAAGRIPALARRRRCPCRYRASSNKRQRTRYSRTTTTIFRSNRSLTTRACRTCDAQTQRTTRCPARPRRSDRAPRLRHRNRPASARPLLPHSSQTQQQQPHQPQQFRARHKSLKASREARAFTLAVSSASLLASRAPALAVRAISSEIWVLFWRIEVMLKIVI